ncbi:MAG: alpha/beta fold hydrolase [Gemmatimonadaceae bacterium]|jgi:pimeloyl-ACP methyl ester carboxylesterase|nr:alpha/beta fold hydrolase [Gemmatimonadaceae bacterium]
MLLLLHGALGDRTTLASLRDALVARGETVLDALEFEGHGASAPATRPLRLEHFVSQTLDWLDAHGPAHLVGYSMGGYVALVAAARAPERVRSVFTLGTKLRWSPDVASDAITQLDPEVLRAKVPAYAAQLAARHGELHWADVVRGTADALCALGDAPLLTDDTLAGIRCPVRITLGDRDRTVPLEELRWLMSHVPTASACVWPDTPHPLDRAPLPLLADAIRAFRSACRDDASNPAPTAPPARG